MVQNHHLCHFCTKLFKYSVTWQCYKINGQCFSCASMEKLGFASCHSSTSLMPSQLTTRIHSLIESKEPVANSALVHNSICFAPIALLGARGLQNKKRKHIENTNSASSNVYLPSPGELLCGENSEVATCLIT